MNPAPETNSCEHLTTNAHRIAAYNILAHNFLSDLQGSMNYCSDPLVTYQVIHTSTLTGVQVFNQTPWHLGLRSYSRNSFNTHVGALQMGTG